MPEECVGVVGCQRVDGVLPEGCVAWPVGGGDVRQNASFEDIGRCQGDTSGVEDREDAVRGLVGIGCHLDEGDLQHEVLNEVLGFLGREDFRIDERVEHRPRIVVDATHGSRGQAVCLDVEERIDVVTDDEGVEEVTVALADGEARPFVQTFDP